MSSLKSVVREGIVFVLFHAKRFQTRSSSLDVFFAMRLGMLLKNEERHRMGIKQELQALYNPNKMTTLQLYVSHINFLKNCSFKLKLDCISKPPFGGPLGPSSCDFHLVCLEMVTLVQNWAEDL
eukprot:6466804-Amphidinium_carterae.1